MTRRQVMRIVAAVLGGIAVGLAFLAALLVLNTEKGLAGCTAAAGGWTIPVLAGIVVGGAAWLLLSKDDSHESGALPLAALCDDCGRPMSPDWRMCPHCGALTPSDAETGASSTA